MLGHDALLWSAVTYLRAHQRQHMNIFCCRHELEHKAAMSKVGDIDVAVDLGSFSCLP